VDCGVSQSELCYNASEKCRLTLIRLDQVNVAVGLARREHKAGETSPSAEIDDLPGSWRQHMDELAGVGNVSFDVVWLSGTDEADCRVPTSDKRAVARQLRVVEVCFT
jgi:hypothetical protein